MTSTSVDKMIEDYLKHLESAMSKVPAPRRQQIIAEISEHLTEARSALPEQSDVAVMELLDRVGRPEDIAVEAMGDEGNSAGGRSHHVLIGAVIVLVVLLFAAIGVAIASSGPNPRSPSASHGAHAPHKPKLATTTTTTNVPTTTTSPSTTTVPVSTPTPVTANRSILAPATTPPLVDECSQHLTYSADQSFGPITCDNGTELNVVAWSAAAAFNPVIMTLGPNPTPVQVNNALCAEQTTIPIETETYQLVAMYYQWSFGYDPTQGLTSDPSMCSQ